MALFEDLDPVERQHPLTLKVRQELGIPEFTRRLAEEPAVVHAAAVEAFKAGDKALHERLLHIGWLLNRHKLRQTPNANLR